MQPQATIPRCKTATHRGTTLAPVVGFLLLLLSPISIHSAAGAGLSEPDKTCIGCHGSQGMEKKLSNGEALSLFVDGDVFAKSVHIAIGCKSCHPDIDLDKHPGDKAISSARDYAIASIQKCRRCHTEKYNQYESSIHAKMVREGNAAAPICSDCHAPHEIMANEAANLPTLPCQGCHTAIYDAYTVSVHGKARAKPGSYAPLCFGCHTAHVIAETAAGLSTRDNCLTCHDGVEESHAEWLPNAGLHLDTVSCPACHTSTKQRYVDLRLFASGRTGKLVSAPGLEARMRQATEGGQALDAMTIWTLLRGFNQQGGTTKAMLRGRLDVRSGTEAHELNDKSKAVRDCRACHRQGAEPFQTVSISVVGKDGLPVRFAAEKDVLNSVFSLQSISGFYLIGSTRIQFLDILLLLVFFGSLAGVCAHMTVRWLFRRLNWRNQGAAPHG